MYDMINFYFKLSGSFPIFKNDCLLHVNMSTKKYLLDNYITFRRQLWILITTFSNYCWALKIILFLFPFVLF